MPAAVLVQINHTMRDTRKIHENLKDGICSAMSFPADKRRVQMNNVKNNWFYKLCVKQCFKDMVWIIGGILSVVFGVALIAIGGDILITLTFILLGIGMILIGADAVFVKFPKLRKTLETMDGYEYETLGETAPQCLFKTFYMTKGYLCTPVDYVMIPYKSISGTNVREHTYKGQVKGGYLDLELNDGTGKKTLHVKDRKFVRESGMLLDLIEQGRNDTLKG